MKFFISITCFFLVFGPKFGPIDTSVIAATILILPSILFMKFRVNKMLIIFCLIFIVLTTYSLFIVFAFDTNDSYTYLRNIRALINTFAIGIFFINFKVDPKFCFKLIVNLLSINAIVIVLQILFIDLQYKLGPLYGFDKSYSTFRAFGLTPGYDSAGYLCVIGLVFIFSKYLNKGEVGYKDFFLVYLFAAAGCLTGRSVMLIMIVCLILFNAYIILKGKRILKLLGVFNFIFGSVLMYKFVLPIIINTIPFLQDQNISSSVLVETDDLKYSYSSKSGDLLTSMWFLPDSPIKTIFGAGFNPNDSDIGYIKVIFMLGFVGLLIMVLYHLVMFIKAINVKQNSYFGNVLISGLKFTIFLLFIFNAKTLYFFSRGFHEILTIAFFAIISVDSKNNITVNEIS